MNYKIIGKYIKDIANYKINIDIKSNQVKQNIIEVLTTLNLNPVKNNFEKINAKVVFSSIIELQNEKIEKKEIEKIVLVSVPSEVYREVRKIFINLFEHSGFKDVKVNETVDFQKLYEMRRVQ